MAELHVKIVEIEEVKNAENSDRLSSVRIGSDWWVISSKVPVGTNPDSEASVFNAQTSLPPEVDLVYEHAYKPGDKCIYIPPDTVSNDIKFIKFFFDGSKITPDSLIKHRFRSIKIRKNMSFGAILDLSEGLFKLYPELKNKKLGEDVASILSLTKYEPPESSIPNGMRVKQLSYKNPLFKEYTEIDNFKWYGTVFEPGEEVVINIKCHGSNMRIGYLPFVPYKLNLKPTLSLIFSKDTLGRALHGNFKFLKINLGNLKDQIWLASKHKVQGLLGKTPEWEILIGSHRVQISRKPNYKGWYGEDIYSKVAEKYALLDVLEPNMILFGEVYGPTVQQGFNYGLKGSDLGYVAFDLMVDGKYADYDVFKEFCTSNGIPMCPEVYRRPFSMEAIHKYTNDHSHEFDKGNPCREGVVCRPIKERISSFMGRVILKNISDSYYTLKTTTDWH